MLALLLPLLLLGSAAPVPLQGERVVERRFASELELATDGFEFEASGEGRTAQQQGPPSQREEAYEIEISDTLFDREEPPARFARHYRTVTSALKLSGADTPLERTGSAGLEGRRVTFEREEDGRYRRTCADEDVRRGQLERLRADLSLACFLPPADAAEGAATSFEVPFAAFARVLAPLEEGARRQRKRPPGPAGGLNLAPAALLEPIGALMAAAEGTLTVTPRARAEGDELPANAALAFRFGGTHDGSAGLFAGEGEAEDEVVCAYEGTGALAWDPESGRIELHCQGELRLHERFRVSVSAGDASGVVRGRLELSGTLALAASEDPE